MTEAAIIPVAREEKLGEYLKRPDVQKRLMEAIGKKVNIDEFISNVIMDVTKSEELQLCSFPSILKAAIDAANFGLVPNKTLGHAYLIPFNNKTKGSDGKWSSQWEATLMIGYKGYVKKFGESNATPEVELVTKQEVEAGRFREIRGSESKILHEPIREGIRDKENIALGYAIIRQPGRQDVISVMSFAEIMEAGKSQVWKDGKKISAHKGVWVTEGAARNTDFAEMCKKTLIRRAAKLTDIDVVNKMSAHEGEIEKNLQDVTPAQAAQPLPFLQNFKAQHGTPQQIENAPAMSFNMETPRGEALMAAQGTIQETPVQPQQLDLIDVVATKEKPAKSVAAKIEPILLWFPDGTKFYPIEVDASGIIAEYVAISFPPDSSDFKEKNAMTLPQIAAIERKNGNDELADQIEKIVK